MKAVLAYLEKVDPAAAQRARERAMPASTISARTSRLTASSPALGRASPASSEVVEPAGRAAAPRAGLLRAATAAWPRTSSSDAEQNARLVRDAEALLPLDVPRARCSSWNLRDRHMADTLTRWRPISSGNGRAGEDRRLGAQLASGRRPRHGDGPARRAEPRPARARAAPPATAVLGRLHHPPRHGHRRLRLGRRRPSASGCGPRCADSYEALFHDAGPSAFLLTWLRRRLAGGRRLARARLERAIGVIYRPETERQSHYFGARLPDQFDAVLHFDETRAVEPLEYTAEWEAGEVPETFPTGL